MNSDWDVVPHQRNLELSSSEVNGGAIIFWVKRCSHKAGMCKIVSRRLVSMGNTCRQRTPSMRDINIEVPPELY